MPTPFALARSLAAGMLVLALAACGNNSGGPAAGSGSGASVTPFVEDVVMGDPAAPVAIIEYASLTCTHCRNFWKQDFPRLKSQYIDTGKVSYVLRDYPTNPPEIAIAGAAIARCAGKDKYYAVVDDIFNSYHEVMDAAREARAGPVLVTIGGRHGLSPEQVKACVDSPAVMEYIERTARLAAEQGVNSTPTVFLNGKKVEDHRFAALSAAIESALNPASAQGAAPETAPGAAPEAATAPASGSAAP